MILLFRASTGEDWGLLLFDCKDKDYVKYYRYATSYWFTFVLMSTFIMLNLFVMIIIDYFENFNLKEDNPLELFNNNVETFKKVWNTYCDETGEKI